MIRMTLLVCLLSLLQPVLAAHASGTPAQPSPAPADAPSVGATGPGPAGDSMDFDLLGEKPKPSPAVQAADLLSSARLEKQVQTRRRVLLAHQALGFITLAAMAATCVIGQMNYVARYGSFNNGQDYDTFQNAHIGLVSATSVLFATIGVLGVAAPNPYPKPIKFDTALVHKVSMILATAGMVTQLILGPITTYSQGAIEQRNLALGHVVAGWATFGFMSAGVLAYVF
jgi:hypothetical protein